MTSSLGGTTLLLTLLLVGGIVAYLLMEQKNNPKPPPPGPDPKPSPGPSKKKVFVAADLQRMWASEGILNTSFSITQICPEFRDGSIPCLSNVEQCTIPDCSDYNILNSILATAASYVSCFALATSLQKKGLAQIVFGPYMAGGTGDSGDMTIGLFLDLSVLKPYIACMWPMDAATIGRYSNDPADMKAALELKPDVLKNRYNSILNACENGEGCALRQAGCGGSGGPSNAGYNFTTRSYKPPTYTPAGGMPQLANGWAALPNVQGTMLAFGREDMEPYVDTTRNVQIIAGAQSDPDERGDSGRCAKSISIDKNGVREENTCGDYLSYQFVAQNVNTGYRETEIDVFVPQEPSSAVPASNKCVPAKEFVDDFKKAIVGVYATPWCAQTLAYYSGPSKQCCTPEFSKALAKKIADAYNAKADNPNKIGAYYWTTDSADGSWNPDQHTTLLITEII